ncbi:hypothetical protein QUF90_04295 [Desulfococcaceae bacterium HSG9]|nr:hypothetical protein [Desulfococcaceae bacterium HSG9]
MIIDAHAHCGIQDLSPPQDLEDYLSYIEGSAIRGVVVFAPVMEIYDRYDADFADTTEWRRRRKSANQYLLTLSKPDFEVIPYFFIWNDFLECVTAFHFTFRSKQLTKRMEMFVVVLTCVVDHSAKK